MCPNCSAKFSTAYGLRTHLRNSEVCKEDPSKWYLIDNVLCMHESELEIMFIAERMEILTSKKFSHSKYGGNVAISWAILFLIGKLLTVV